VSETPTSKRSVLAFFGVFAGLSLFGVTGCYAEVQAEPAYVTTSEAVTYEEPVVYVETVPVNVETYPRVYYRGSYVYWVDGRWYSRGPRGWGYYRAEPRGLVTYRTDFERRYPHGYAHVDAHAHVDVERRAYGHSHHDEARVHEAAPVHREYHPAHAGVSASGSVKVGAKATTKPSSSSKHHH
jgi:hypothetical protein